jgi:hypothetical protein
MKRRIQGIVDVLDKISGMIHQDRSEVERSGEAFFNHVTRINLIQLKVVIGQVFIKRIAFRKIMRSRIPDSKSFVSILFIPA